MTAMATKRQKIELSQRGRNASYKQRIRKDKVDDLLPTIRSLFTFHRRTDNGGRRRRSRWKRLPVASGVSAPISPIVEGWQAFLPRQFAGQFVRNAAPRPLIGCIIVHVAEEIKRDDRSKRSTDFASRIMLCTSRAGYFRINITEWTRRLRFSKKIPEREQGARLIGSSQLDKDVKSFDRKENVINSLIAGMCCIYTLYYTLIFPYIEMDWSRGSYYIADNCFREILRCTEIF